MSAKEKGMTKSPIGPEDTFQRPLRPQTCCPALPTFTEVPDNHDALGSWGACQRLVSEQWDEYLPSYTYKIRVNTLKQFPWARGTLHVILFNPHTIILKKVMFTPFYR